MSCAVCESLRPLMLEHVTPGQRCTIVIWRAAMQKSVTDRGCAECELLFNTVVTAKGDVKIDWGSESKSLRLTTAKGLPLQIIDGSAGLYLEMYHRYCNPTESGMPSTIGYGSAISKRSVSDESVALVSSWLSECETKHRLCKPSTACSPPTRLLRLNRGATGQIGLRLIDASHLHDRYVAPSYSWVCPSKHPQLKTTKDLLSRHKDNIDFHSLPRTLQDAAVLTRKLGFEHLWVDALCIIQDDEKDWNVEAARMSEVYMNASETLVASRSTGSSDVLLGEHS